ncbi:MAG: hypothetical protein AAFQ99_07285 [Pseudomonadota bacterium]
MPVVANPNSTYYVGEKISGSFTLSVNPTSDPPPIVTDLTGTTLQMMVKANLADADTAALATLAEGSGLTVTSSAADQFVVDFAIPGSATANLTAQGTQSTASIYAEINALYAGEADLDVLEIYEFKIDTARVRKTL